MTVLGIITVVAIAATWMLGRRWTQLVVGATVAFPQTAAVVIGENGLPLFYVAVTELALLSAPGILLAIAWPHRAKGDATRLAADIIGIALVAWGAVITIAGPRIFGGIRVFDPALGVDSQVVDMGVLQPSLGNIAQLGYLALAVLFVMLAGRRFPVDSRLLESAFWTALVLAAVRLIAEPVWPYELLQNMPGYPYATPERLSGTFYEPSVLGLYLVGAACYFATRLWLPSASARARAAAVVALALIAVEVIANRSGTAILGLAVVVPVAGAMLLVRQLRDRRIVVRPMVVVLGTAALGIGLTQLPALYALTIGTAEQKASSFSFFARGLANERSWELFIETAGLGVGLGSHRPSSLFFLVLSCLGIVGTVLLAALIAVALHAAKRTPTAGPAGWALFGILVAAVIAVPDLSMPIIWVALAACLAASVAAPSRSAGSDTQLLPGAAAQIPALERREITK